MQQSLPLEASSIAMFILLLATTVESLYFVSLPEYDWGKVDYMSDIVELLGTDNEE
jgi:hypothetical protein